jgi:pyruvate kinase
MSLESELREIRAALVVAERRAVDQIATVHPSQRRSATNLVHYVELRKHDVRGLQLRLASVGLSSLSRAEAHVLSTIESVLNLLASLTNQPAPKPTASLSLTDGRDQLAVNACRLLGPIPPGRSTRIMVTLPSEAADDGELIADMLAGGMDLGRVNCADDDAAAWAKMIAQVKRGTTKDGRRCLVAMDLAGPKLRTGPLKPGPQAMRVHPKRNPLGAVLLPGRAWLVAPGAIASRSDPAPAVPVEDAAWISRRRPGDRLELVDSRGAKRRWTVAATGAGRCLVTTDRTTYITTGIQLWSVNDDAVDAVVVGELPEIEQVHRVQHHDRVILTRSMAPADLTIDGSSHTIGCSMPEVFGYARPGERVWLNNGKIGGVIERVSSDEIEVVVTNVGPGGANLKANQAISLPDTALHLDAISDQDLEDLAFVAAHADIVNVSFVRRPQDVDAVLRELDRLGAIDVGIVLKIENLAAFECLPELLLSAMYRPRVGVMIARGDLAIEVGFGRMAEVQEEILWLCESALVPVVWATHVLDTLARTGQASQSETTDAAMGEWAECVMLNKGSYIRRALVALDSILTRMNHHQDKKRNLLHKLESWDRPVPA